MIEADPLWRRKQQLAHRYGITYEQYQAMLEAQDGKCAICGLVPEGEFHVDHDHSCCAGSKSCGECVRGLLCQPCNHMLGNAKDSPDRLVAAAAYLMRGGQ